MAQREPKLWESTYRQVFDLNQFVDRRALVVNERGVPIECDHCPCPPRGDVPTPGPGCTACDPELVLPTVLYATFQLQYGTSPGCMPCISQTPSWSETWDAQLHFSNSLIWYEGGGLTPRETFGWIGHMCYETVDGVAASSVHYPPYPSFPHPFVICDNGNPHDGTADGDESGQFGGTPCFYLERQRHCLTWQIFCHQDRWRYQVIAPSIEGAGGFVGLSEDPDDIVQCSPFAIVPTTPFSILPGGAPPASYAPGSENEYCGSRNCKVQGTVKLHSVME